MGSLSSGNGVWCSVVLPGCLSFMKLAVSSVVVGFLCPTCSASRSEESERSFPFAETAAASSTVLQSCNIQDGTCWRSPITSVSRSVGFLLYWKNSCWQASLVLPNAQRIASFMYHSRLQSGLLCILLGFSLISQFSVLHQSGLFYTLLGSSLSSASICPTPVWHFLYRTGLLSRHPEFCSAPIWPLLYPTRL